MSNAPLSLQSPILLEQVLLAASVPVSHAAEAVGTELVLRGWVARKRDHGKVTFIDLRDRTGILQCVGYKLLGELKPEAIVAIRGLVKQRPEKMVDTSSALGAFELEVKEYVVLNQSSELPIPIDTDGLEISEEVRMEHRYLDLRRERMRKNLVLRSDLARAIRAALAHRTFTEVETPLLTKSTKEGARDFVVPSRMHPGQFYALPQSPQQYKQLLMTAGVERYYQLARCVRDEDLRADRGFEFTQVDLEMSFVTQTEVMQTVESVVIEAISAVGGVISTEPFPIIAYEDAMATYGADRFDMRTDQQKLRGELAFAWVVDFPFFKKVDTSDQAEVRDGKSGWTFTHNPFSTPIPQHVAQHLAGKDVGEIITAQYDLVCNGFEVGGGSIRAHDPAVLRATFEIMGYSADEIEESVGHMLRALSLGTPPHGGIALGFDRLVMLLAGERSLREVIPFPMNATGRPAMMAAPSPISDVQLAELGISVVSQSEHA